MNNTDKLIASQYIVKQAMMSKILKGISSFGSKAKNAIPQLGAGAANPIEANANMWNMLLLPKHMGGSYDKFDKNVLLQGLGGAGLLSGITGVGVNAGRQAGMDEGERAGVAKTTQKVLDAVRKRKQYKEDRGYLGRLMDAVTNKDYNSPESDFPGLKSMGE